MKKRLFIAAMAVAGLSGCAGWEMQDGLLVNAQAMREKEQSNVAELEAKLAQGHGHSIDVVITKMGAPSSVAKLTTGESVYTWTISANQTTGGRYVPVTQITPSVTTINRVGSMATATTTPGATIGGYYTPTRTNTLLCRLHFRVNTSGTIVGSSTSGDCGK